MNFFHSCMADQDEDGKKIGISIQIVLIDPPEFFESPMH